MRETYSQKVELQFQAIYSVCDIFHIFKPIVVYYNTCRFISKYCRDYKFFFRSFSLLYVCFLNLYSNGKCMYVLDEEGWKKKSQIRTHIKNTNGRFGKDFFFSAFQIIHFSKYYAFIVLSRLQKKRFFSIFSSFMCKNSIVIEMPFMSNDNKNACFDECFCFLFSQAHRAPYK